MTLYERPRAEQPPIWMGTDETDPGPGTYLVLRYHHDGESHWSSDEQIQARLEFILDGGKPDDEIGWRLAEMRVYRYSPELAAALAAAQSAYYAALAAAQSARDAAVAPAQSAYYAALAAAQSAYYAALAAARSAYDAVVAPAQSAYYAVVAPARSAYYAAVAAAQSARDAAVRRAVRGLPHVSGAQWMEGQRP